MQQDPSLADVDIVIGADTVIVKDEHVLEKPRDKNHALEMLQQLSGQTHYVLTGVQIIYKTEQGTIERCQFVERTNVVFSTLDTETMNACKLRIKIMYVTSPPPF